MPQGIRRTNKVEVKYWEYEGGRKAGHKPKTEETAIECTLILKGRVKGTIDRQPVEFSEGKYFVVPPGVENNVPDFADEDCVGLTIKAPSIRGSRKKVFEGGPLPAPTR